MKDEIITSIPTAIGELLHGAGAELPSVTRDIFLATLAVVGTRYLGAADQIVAELQEGSPVSVFHEADNEFDKDAILIMDQAGRKLGYLSRSQNSIVASLLDAGKIVYGYVVERPERMHNDETAPYRFYIDLYMREFLAPEDVRSIPLHGYRGSYVVLALNEIEDSNDSVFGFCALKILNGEERTYLERTSPPQTEKERMTDLMKLLDEFIGHLPVVSHALYGVKLEALKEAYGHHLGKPFSNLIIDTEKMAQIHMPGITETTLGRYVDHLGLTCEAETALERECRLVWKLYCKMERSEVKAKKRPDHYTREQ